MRSWKRPSVAAPTLQDNGAGGKKRKVQVEKFEADGTIPLSFPGHWTEPDVRGVLYAMQGRICTFCGADISEAGIDVEHFRPKGNVAEDAAHGGYWWLAYELSNYMLSCTICNQRLKKDRFPLLDPAQRVRYPQRHLIAAEPKVLLDPVGENVEAMLALDPQAILNGRIVPHPALGEPEATRVRETIDFFRLNRKAAQVRKRRELIKEVDAAVNSGHLSKAKEYAIRYRQHSLVARLALQEKAPGALPTPLEEMRWLLEELASELLFKLEDLEAGGGPLDEKEARELAWALAAIWKDPPVGSSADVAQFLVERGLHDFVEEFLAKL